MAKGRMERALTGQSSQPDYRNQNLIPSFIFYNLAPNILAVLQARGQDRLDDGGVPYAQEARDRGHLEYPHASRAAQLSSFQCLL